MSPCYSLKLSLRFIPLIALTLLFFLLFMIREASAEHLFQTQNTWYEKIPSNPVRYPDSDNYINDILINSNTLNVNYGEWSVPIYYAPKGTSNVTVTLDNPSSPYCGSNSVANRWNIVPIPSVALPAGNNAACAGSYRDGHMVVYNDTYVWEFYRARKCSDGIWRAACVRRYDRSGNGIVTPYDGKGSCRACVGATLAHGIVLKSEIEAGVIDHALAFYYHGEKKDGYWAIYPCKQYRGGINSRTFAMLIGQRIQLNPSVNCNNLGLSNFGVIICKAMQDYGMIFIDSSGPSDQGIMIENRARGTNAVGDWSGILGNIRSIPINQMRVVQPVCSDCSSCPNCVKNTPIDTIPPAPPLILKIE